MFKTELQTIVEYLTPNTQHTVYNLESHLNTINNYILCKTNCRKYYPYLPHILTLLTERYHSLVHTTSTSTPTPTSTIYGYLLNKLVLTLSSLYGCIVYLKNKKMPYYVEVVLLDCLLEDAKKEGLYGKRSDCLANLLRMIGMVLEGVKRKGRVEGYYPKCFSVVAGLMREGGRLGVENWGLVLDVLAGLVEGNYVFGGKMGKTVLYGKDGALNIEENNCSREFALESLRRFITELQNIYNTLWTMDRGYLSRLKTFILHTGPRILNNPPSSPSLSPSLSPSSSPSSSLSPSTLPLLHLHYYLYSHYLLLYLNLYLQPPSPVTLYHQSLSYHIYQTHTLSYINQLITISYNIVLKHKILSSLASVVYYVKLRYEEYIGKLFIKLLEDKIFWIGGKDHLIRMMEYSHSIPLKELDGECSVDEDRMKELECSFVGEYKRMLAYLLGFCYLDIQLIEDIQKVVKKLSVKSLRMLLYHFGNKLSESEYTLRQSLTSFYKYLTLLIIVYELLVTLTAINDKEIGTSLKIIFDALVSHSEALTILLPNYREYYLLIVLSVNILSICYKLYSIQNVVCEYMVYLRHKIVVCYKIMNCLEYYSYIIRLCCLWRMLALVDDSRDRDSDRGREREREGGMDMGMKGYMVKNCLENVQSTLIHRNKDNLALMKQLLVLSYLVYYEYDELSEYYMGRRGSYYLIKILLKKISIYRGRQCILAAYRFHILLKDNLMLYDHKPMKCSTNSNEHFHSGDGDNVRIGNALGVMVLELGERWKEGLLGKDKEGVIDLLLKLVKVDKELVFFRGGFQSVLEGFIGVLVWGLGLYDKGKGKDGNRLVLVDKQRMGYKQRVVDKVMKLLYELPYENYKYYNVYRLRYVLEEEHGRLSRRYLEMEMEDDEERIEERYKRSQLVLRRIEEKDRKDDTGCVG